jgi:DNA polymerase delta subunit 1
LKKKTIYGYFGSGFQNFMKITCSLPKFIPKAKTILEGGNFSCDSFRGIQLAPFESNISYTLRFMIDCKVTGLNWIEIKKENWKRTADKLTTAQLEVDVHYSNLISHSPEGEWSKVAPLRILSFDIECAGRKGVFPDSSIDPVIQIASVVTLQGESSPFIKNVFTLNSCAHIFDAHILSYKNEDDLLLNWSEFFRLVDPDIVTGYNIMNFDWPYLLSRAETLKVSGFPYLGRLKGFFKNNIRL